MSFNKHFSLLSSYVVAGCVCVAALGLSGCSTEPEPALTSPTAAPSSFTPKPSDSTSPPATQLEQPQPTAGMANNDAQGAKEAADYFGKMITYIMATQNTDLLDTFAVEGCLDCDVSKEVLKGLTENNETYEEFKLEYVLEETPQKLEKNMWYAGGYLQTSAYTIVNSESEVVATGKPEKREGTFITQFTEDGWRLQGMFPTK